jgi:hypothetical protein
VEEAAERKSAKEERALQVAARKEERQRKRAEDEAARAAARAEKDEAKQAKAADAEAAKQAAKEATAAARAEKQAANDAAKEAAKAAAAAARTAAAAAKAAVKAATPLGGAKRKRSDVAFDPAAFIALPLPARVPDTSVGVATHVHATGVLRPEPAFRILSTGVNAKGKLVPVGFLSEHLYKNWRCQGDAAAKPALVRYMQEVRMGATPDGAPTPLFAVWPSDAPLGTPDGFECVAADPGAAWEEVAARVAAATAAAAAPAEAAGADAAGVGGAGAGRKPRRLTDGLFGLDSPFVQALLETLPRPPECEQPPRAYVTLQARALVRAAAAAAAVAAAAAQEEGAGGGMCLDFDAAAQ